MGRLIISRCYNVHTLGPSTWPSALQSNYVKNTVKKSKVNGRTICKLYNGGILQRRPWPASPLKTSFSADRENKGTILVKIGISSPSVVNRASHCFAEAAYLSLAIWERDWINKRKEVKHLSCESEGQVARDINWESGRRDFKIFWRGAETGACARRLAGPGHASHQPAIASHSATSSMLNCPTTNLLTHSDGMQPILQTYSMILYFWK